MNPGDARPIARKEARQLEIDEGYRRKPYKDTVGKLTIGIGRNLDDVGLSLEEARYLLANDIRTAVDTVDKFLDYYGVLYSTLSDERFCVLVNMGMNLGLDRLKGFKRFGAALAIANFSRAADEMEDSLWRKQVGARAERLIKRMRDG